MIELRDYSWEDQLELVRGCESFFITYKSPNWQKSITKKLTEEFGKRYISEIKVLLTGASKAKRHNLTGISLPMQESCYVTANKITQKNVSRKRMKELIALMEDEGYLLFMLGYYHHKRESIMSCVRFHPKLLDNLEKKSCDKWGMSREGDAPSVEVIDTENSTKVIKKYHSLRKFKGSGVLVDEVKLINKVTGSGTITYRGKLCYVRYKRRFEGDLTSGGRLYVLGTFQVEDADYRDTIMIDGESTIEMDVCCIHPSLLATRLGCKLPDNYDPYDIGYLLEKPLPREVIRPLMKACFMALLYAKHRGTALYEIREKLSENGTLPSWLNEKDILKALEEHNVILESCFYNKDQWKYCQFLDSSIAVQVMLHFAKKGVVCLNYHDSWRVKACYEEELITVMRESWLAVVGNLDNLRFKKE